MPGTASGVIPLTIKSDTPPFGKTRLCPSMNVPSTTPPVETVNGLAKKAPGKSRMLVNSEPEVILYSNADAAGGSNQSPLGTLLKMYSPDGPVVGRIAVIGVAPFPETFALHDPEIVA